MAINRETGISIGLVILLLSGSFWLKDSLAEKADKKDIEKIEAKAEKDKDNLTENEKLDIEQTYLIQKVQDSQKVLVVSQQAIVEMIKEMREK